MIKAVIVDVNGVLVRSELFTTRFRKEFDVPEEDVRSALYTTLPLLRLPRAPRCYALWKPYLDRWNVPLSEKDFLHFWFSGETLDREMLAYIRTLKSRGMKIFLLSNNFQERTEYYQKTFPELFIIADGVYFSWQTGFIKSEQEAYRNVLKDNNFTAEECLFVDDNKENIATAEKAGIKTHLFRGLKELRTVVNSLKPQPL